MVASLVQDAGSQKKATLQCREAKVEKGPGKPRRAQDFFPVRAGLRSLVSEQIIRDQHWSEENVLRHRAHRGCYRPPMLWEAGERPGSACAIEVEGLKRRPPT